MSKQNSQAEVSEDIEAAIKGAIAAYIGSDKFNITNISAYSERRSNKAEKSFLAQNIGLIMSLFGSKK